MEKFVSADYVQFKNDDSNKSNNSSNTPMCFSSNFEKNECKGCGKISRVKKKVVSQESFVNQSDPFDNVTLSKNKKRSSIPKAQVLNKITTEAARQSVQKKTKIIKRNVPDRLGKYVSYSVRSETKLFLSDCKLKTKSPSCECKKISDFKSLKEHSKVKLLFDGYTETKLALIGNECLSKNKEAVSLSNSFESDSVRKNIFESFFDNCLSSTSEEKDASSQVNLYFKDNSNSLKINSETVGKYNLLESLENWEKGSVKGVESDKTPPKKNRGSSPPLKIKDHSNYYKSHKNIRHVCGYCQKIFKSNGKLNNHVFSHTGERPFHCSHCGKAFSSKFKLVRHLLIHSEIRKFVCQICDRTFLRNDHLKNHYKVHDPQKKMYKCPKENCDKEYSSIMSHKKHMAYHSVEDGDLKCLICHVKYETKEEILFHLKSHSGSRLFKSQSDKKFKCEFCERLFLTRKDVTRHLVVHTGERDFLCQFCPQRFGRKDHLVRHIKKSHGNESITTFKREEVKGLKEKMKTSDDQKTKLIKKRQIGKDLNSTSSITLQETRPCSHSDSTTLAPGNIQKEDNDDHKTHVVITVQGKSMENGLQCRKRNSVENENKKKSFQKNESASPNKKQVVLAKTKNSTTQILLQNVPNILIIPNNSIILVRNQGPGMVRKSAEQSATRAALDGESLARAPESSAPHLEGDFLGQPPPSLQTPATSDSFNGNLTYDSPSLFSSSQFLEAYPDGDGFCNFQADLMSCASQFGESFQPSFEMLNRTDLLPRSEAGSIGMPSNVQPRSEAVSNGNLLTETSRQIKLLESGISALQSGGEEKADKEKTECEALGKDFFEDGLLNESILNDFKDETSGILPTDHDVSILSNILNQSSDNCGFELLKNLLTSENPSPSPLPGFSQIFQNSNTHSN